jgi:hypothetical protein
MNPCKNCITFAICIEEIKRNIEPLKDTPKWVYIPFSSLERKCSIINEVIKNDSNNESAKEIGIFYVREITKKIDVVGITNYNIFIFSFNEGKILTTSMTRKET